MRLVNRITHDIRLSQAWERLPLDLRLAFWSLRDVEALDSSCAREAMVGEWWEGQGEWPRLMTFGELVGLAYDSELLSDGLPGRKK